MEIVIIAAWFHDLGYSKSHDDHEEEGCKITREFLEAKNLDDDFIVQVEKCIRATKLGVEPETLNEKILSDADLSHAGKGNFMELSDLYRKEVCNFEEGKCSKLGYWEKNAQFSEFYYFSYNYAKEHLDKVKTENIEKVQKRIKKIKMNKKAEKEAKALKSTARGTENCFSPDCQKPN